MHNQVEKYIYGNWESTFRYQTEDEGVRLGLPFPYTVAGVSEIFQEMYYWGTYFTNIGLILSGYVEQARNNVDNMLWLVEKYGFMLNTHTTWSLTRSQPPFLSQMVREVYEATDDKKWLLSAYEALKKEYHFWQTERITSTGLNRYFGASTNLKHFAEIYCERLNLEMPADEQLIAEYGYSCQSGCESGWDFSSRCGLFNHRYNWSDLNALLYGMEKNMEFFSKELEKGEEEQWHAASEKRAGLMNQYMWNEELGFFTDYNFVDGEQNTLATPAVFVPMFTGVATEEQAKRIVETLGKLEKEFGLASSECRDDILNGQWDYPHGWPPSNLLAIKGLLRYGYTAEAKRLAEKLCRVMELNFEKTGYLWEKYNTEVGKISSSQEYRTPPLMGWSASSYLFCKNLLEISKS